MTRPDKSPAIAGGKVKRAIARCTAKRRFEQKGDAWYSTVIATGSGQGRYDEAEALAQHHRLIGFDVLATLGYSDDEMRDFDWHLWPTDSVEAFVAKGIAEWTEVLNARAELAPINALISAVTGRARP